MEFSSTFTLSAILASAVPLALVLGYCNRKRERKGIGWQFIRWMVLMVSLPIIGVLALNDLLSGEAAALIGSAMGYLITTQAKRNLSSRSGIGGVLSAT